MKFLFDNGNQHVSRDRTPDLGLDSVLAVAKELLDSQMLLDPFEEQLDLPAVFVKCGNGQRWQDKVVGQENQRLATFWILETDTTQVLWIILSGIKTIEQHSLIADDAGGLVHRMRALRIEVGTSITAARVVRVMNELIECYGKPRAIRLDNGAELTAQIFVDWAEENEIQLRFIQPGKPNQNAFIERFNKSYREEVLDANLFNTLTEVQAATDEWVMDYNEFRPHESLGRVPPTTFMPRVFKQEVSISDL